MSNVVLCLTDLLHTVAMLIMLVIYDALRSCVEWNIDVQLIFGILYCNAYLANLHVCCIYDAMYYLLIQIVNCAPVSTVILMLS